MEFILFVRSFFLISLQKQSNNFRFKLLSFSHSNLFFLPFWLVFPLNQLPKLVADCNHRNSSSAISLSYIKANFHNFCKSRRRRRSRPRRRSNILEACLQGLAITQLLISENWGEGRNAQAKKRREKKCANALFLLPVMVPRPFRKGEGVEEFRNEPASSHFKMLFLDRRVTILG